MFAAQRQLRHIWRQDRQVLAENGLKQRFFAFILPLLVLWQCRHKLTAGSAAHLAAAALCYYYFTVCHRGSGDLRLNILLGDYFFGRFLQLLLQSGQESLFLGDFITFTYRHCAAGSRPLPALLVLLHTLCQKLPARNGVTAGAVLTGQKP